MKIETTIKPRKDGTVTVEAPDGKHVFAQASDGRMLADVASEADIRFLLGLGTFSPADEADFDRANDLLDSADHFVDDGNVIGEVDDLDDDDEPDMDAAPIESPVSAVAAAMAKPKAARAKKVA